MLIDREAATVETAAREYAAEWRTKQGRVLRDRDAVAALLEVAFIAGSCHARRVGVVELDETLRAATHGRRL